MRLTFVGLEVEPPHPSAMKAGGARHVHPSMVANDQNPETWSGSRDAIAKAIYFGAPVPAEQGKTSV